MTAGAPALTALLDELDRLRAAATPGEWVERGRSQEPYVGSGRKPGEYGYVCTPKNPADAALIVAAVNAVPRLTAAVRAALALADELDWLVNDETVDEPARVAHAWTRDRLRKRLTAALGATP
jgi:hypothetical protein